MPGAQNGPRMDDDPVGPRQRDAGGQVGYKHGMGDGNKNGGKPEAGAGQETEWGEQERGVAKRSEQSRLEQAATDAM